MQAPTRQSRRITFNSLLTGVIAFAVATAACGTPYAEGLSGSKGRPTSDAAEASSMSPPSARTPLADAAAAEPTGPQTTDLYHSAKGDPKNQAVVFIHGGPGSNSKSFEISVQDSVAKLGYYVVAYDQRGSLRSPLGTTADYSFARSTQDLDDLIGALGLTKPILLAHSFGGALALQYLERFKGKARSAIFVSSPMNYPETYDTILTQCADRYNEWGRSSDANNVDAVHSQMFPNGVTPPFAFTGTEIEAAVTCLNDAKLYFPEFPTTGEVKFAAAGGLDQDVAATNADVGPGYQANDQLSYTDFTALLAAHKSEVSGIYAPDWDVMFNRDQLQTIQTNVTSFATVPSSGHLIFVDQPDAFVNTLSEMLEARK